LTGDDLVQQARQYLGVPYYHCGRDRHGLDCLGLLLRVAHDLGLTEWDETGYSEQVDTARMRRKIEEFCDYVGAGGTDPEPGDVLLFSIKGSPQHLGLATDQGVIHAYQSAGRVTEHALDCTWKRRLVAVFSWKGLD
jgi:cell wall-associated NlpC family hydrolase